LFKNDQTTVFPCVKQVCAFPNTPGVFAEAPGVRKIHPSSVYSLYPPQTISSIGKISVFLFLTGLLGCDIKKDQNVTISILGFLKLRTENELHLGIVNICGHFPTTEMEHLLAVGKLFFHGGGEKRSFCSIHDTLFTYNQFYLNRSHLAKPINRTLTDPPSPTGFTGLDRLLLTIIAFSLLEPDI
jgi:hypothetical protein